MIGIREYNKKIISLKNTRKMTKTMKMVSASKFKRAHKQQLNAKVYAQRLDELIAQVAISQDTNHPLMAKSSTIKHRHVIIFTSDKGLCGGFNNNIIRLLKSWISQQSSTVELSFSCCGKRGYNALRKQFNVINYYQQATQKPDFVQSMHIAKDLSNLFLSKKVQEIFLAYNIFKGPLLQEPTIEQLLPLDNQRVINSKQVPKNIPYLFEPGAHELFDLILPKYLNLKLYFTLLDNAAGEHGSRMSAMDKASQNTADLIDQYTLLRNRARQSAITTELTEIISGAEALN